MTVLKYPIPVREYRHDLDLSDLDLKIDEFHVWKQDLARSPTEVAQFQKLLSSDELTRAHRFRFDSDRNHFIVARGTLRTLVGHYLTVPPDDLHFSYSSFGRPSVTHHKAASAFDFNISHSGGIALMAFSVGRQIGIDVERIRRNFATGEVAERFFSATERAALGELPEKDRHTAFFHCWTRKEAFIKALGEGLSHPLDQFDVSLDPRTPAAMLATRPDVNEALRWILRDIEVPDGFAAALALEVVAAP